MVLGVISSDSVNIGSDLAIFELSLLERVARSKVVKILHTCSTVTGSLAPWSFQSTVIPRLRAMTPVRIELGVHFDTGESGTMVVEPNEPTTGVAFAATVVCIRLN